MPPGAFVLHTHTHTRTDPRPSLSGPVPLRLLSPVQESLGVPSLLWRNHTTCSWEVYLAGSSNHTRPSDLQNSVGVFPALRALSSIFCLIFAAVLLVFLFLYFTGLSDGCEANTGPVATLKQMFLFCYSIITRYYVSLYTFYF